MGEDMRVELAIYSKTNMLLNITGPPLCFLAHRFSTLHNKPFPTIYWIPPATILQNPVQASITDTRSFNFEEVVSFSKDLSR